MSLLIAPHFVRCLLAKMCGVHYEMECSAEIVSGAEMHVGVLVSAVAFN